jgi:hypothetical protein
MVRLIGLALIGCLGGQEPACASTITIVGDSSRNIVITMEDATIAMVLGDLGKKYGFEVVGLENAKRGEALSETLTGSIDTVLERLLRNWNYVIVRSQAQTGTSQMARSRHHSHKAISFPAKKLFQRLLVCTGRD